MDRDGLRLRLFFQGIFLAICFRSTLAVLVVLAGWSLCPGIRYAAAQQSAELPVLAPVTVTATIENPATGKSTIRGEVIRDLPRGNASINELLKVLPDVQLSEDFNTNETAGEILPPTLSISGGKAFENNFLIDGIGNNSLLDPGAKTETQDLVSDVPGHPQERFLDADLLEEITVYDSNVPVEFGGFTGGVVAVTSRYPEPRPGGRVFYRTTRDGWTRFHLDGGPADGAQAVAGDTLRPRFEKHHFGLDLNLPLGPAGALLGAYRRIQSDLPQPHLGGSKEEHRRLENYFLKSSWELSSAASLDLSASYVPYREERFFADVRDSDFAVEGGGYAVIAGYRHFFPLAELELAAAFRESENSRKAPRHFRNWAATDSKDWGRSSGSDSSREGGFGNLDKDQRDLSLKGILLWQEQPTGPLGHRLKGGFEYQWVRGTFDRPETTFVFKGARLSPDIVCGDDTFACEEEEQFFTLRQVYDPSSVEATINSYHLFAEDLLRYRRLSLRPGVRLSYDDFLENLNLAPRFTATFDLFGDERTVLIAGINRYYGKTLLTYKLREARSPFRSETRTSFQNRLTDWEPAAFQGRNRTRFSRLDTPFSDELAFGLDQALLGGRLSLKYVHREGQDEYARSYGEVQPDGLRYYTLNNHGTSRHDSYRLSWERSWAGHFASLNATYQETTTSNEDYDTTLEADELEDRIWFGDEIILKTDLPRGDYNRPWSVNLTWIAQIPHGFTFTNLTRYRSSFRSLEPTGVLRAIPGGKRRIDVLTGEEIFESLEVYQEAKHEAALIFDWKLGWTLALWGGQELLLSLEVNNVFDEKARAGTGRDTFLVGRQFWAEAEYRF